VLALGQVDQPAELVEVVAGRLLEHHRPAALQGEARQLQVLEDAALDGHAVEVLLQQLLGLVEDAEAGDLRLPLLGALGDHLRVGVVEADQGELVGVLRHPADDAVGVRVPHPQHSQLQRHGGLLEPGPGPTDCNRGVRRAVESFPGG
jgi:hypothetical protein